MENIILSFNVVLPLFLCIILGYFLRRIHMLDETVVKSLNRLCFKVFLPIYLFNNLYNTDISEAFNGKLILFGMLCVLGLFVLLMLVIPRIEKENPRRGVMIQAIFRSNYALFGLPVAISLCGVEKAGPASLMVGIIVPVYNVLAVVTLEAFRGGKLNPWRTVKGIATNPLIIASLVGIVLNLLNIRIPETVHDCIMSLGSVATPLSLVALGGQFQFSSIRGFRRQLTISLLGKLVFSPLLMVTLGILFGFRNEMLVPILVMSGAPTAVSSFPMAQQMGGDGDLAAAVVVFTSGFSIVTIFLWIFILKQMGMI